MIATPDSARSTKRQALLAIARLYGARELLAELTDAGDQAAVGRRTLLVAYVLAPELFKSQRDLAARLGVTEGRVSQMLKPIRAHLSRQQGHLLRNG